MQPPPEYYSSLAPFRQMFAQGSPVLTYHKLGPRPRGVRLKGLYVSAKLFRRQLAELKAAGFGTGMLAEGAGQPANRVVISFDDGYLNAFRHALPALGENQFRAVQFIVADLMGKENRWDLPAGEVQEPLMDAAQIREWLAAGHSIGSHTLTHPFLTQLPPGAAREEITASRKKLEDLFGVPVRDFCYPYGDMNESVRGLVAEAGYTTACTTVSGVNLPGADLLALRRFTARYPTRSLRRIIGRIWGG